MIVTIIVVIKIFIITIVVVITIIIVNSVWPQSLNQALLACRFCKV